MTLATSSNADWNKFTPMTMAVFLKRFTLHDSWLKELVVGSSGHVTLAIGFDLHWNNAVPQGYDTLLLHFDRTYSQRCVQGSWSQPTINDAKSEVLSNAERAGLLESSVFDLRAYQGRQDDIPHPAYDDTLTRSELSLTNWGRIELLHGARVRCIVVDEAGQQLDLATIAPRLVGSEDGA